MFDDGGEGGRSLRLRACYAAFPSLLATLLGPLLILPSPTAQALRAKLLRTDAEAAAQALAAAEAEVSAAAAGVQPLPEMAALQHALASGWPRGQEEEEGGRLPMPP